MIDYFLNISESLLRDPQHAVGYAVFVFYVSDAVDGYDALVHYVHDCLELACEYVDLRSLFFFCQRCGYHLGHLLQEAEYAGFVFEELFLLLLIEGNESYSTLRFISFGYRGYHLRTLHAGVLDAAVTANFSFSWIFDYICRIVPEAAGKGAALGDFFSDLGLVFSCSCYADEASVCHRYVYLYDARYRLGYLLYGRLNILKFQYFLLLFADHQGQYLYICFFHSFFCHEAYVLYGLFYIGCHKAFSRREAVAFECHVISHECRIY